MFNSLSNSTKHKIYETVLHNGLKELRGLIDEIVGEERKMHDSLRKYKKEDAGVLSDFEKMLVQYYVVSDLIFSVCRI